jgi:hypothetical protein
MEALIMVFFDEEDEENRRNEACREAINLFDPGGKIENGR